MAEFVWVEVQVMRGKSVVVTLALILLAILFAAWLDGGEETVRPMEEPVALPEAGR